MMLNIRTASGDCKSRLFLARNRSPRVLPPAKASVPALEMEGKLRVLSCLILRHGSCLISALALCPTI